MRIALLTDGISPYVTGGMQRHSYYLCKYFAMAGVHVDLYHCAPKGVNAESLDCFTEAERNFISPELIEFPSFGKMPGHYIRESYEFSILIAARMKKKAAVDFIYAKGFTAWEILNQKSKGMKVPPVGVNFHGYEMFQVQPGFKNWFQAKFMLQSPVLFNVKNSDFLFSYGGKITEIILGLGVVKERIIEIPSGVDKNWLISQPSDIGAPIRFLYVGRYERRKGIEELSAAIRNMSAQSRSKFTFDFVGPIPLGKRIVGCNYHGELKSVEVLQKVYRNCDVLFVPSFSEGMPNVLLEAMASGLAVVGTKVGAVPSLVDSSNGWILDQVSSHALEGVITKIITSDRQEIQSKKVISLEKVRTSFTWDLVAKQTIDKLVAALELNDNR